MRVGDININTREGKLLLAALAVITTESRTNQTPDQVLKFLHNHAEKMGYDPYVSTKMEVIDMSKRARGFEIVSEDHLKSDFKILPKQGTSKSAGYDFFLPEDTIILPGQSTNIIFTNVKAYMMDDEYLQLHIRSSLGIKKGIVLSNVTGIVDSDYYENHSNDGNIGIALKNNSDYQVNLKEGDRIMQGIFHKYLPSDNCNALEKRKGGYGSTNNKK